MTRLVRSDSEGNPKGTATAYLGGAVAVLMYSLHAFVYAAQWFDYVLGITMLCLAASFVYAAVHSMAQGRRTADEQSHR
jgi:hypothetical protein